ncbi:MAG: VCBS repeat-containing protein [Pirellulales bacterium]|nr:VCBS repeat-containing protein [Pirellulales bacterium]
MALEQPGMLSSWISQLRHRGSKGLRTSADSRRARFRRPPLAIESLERRELMVSRVFLDFGNGFTTLGSGVFTGTTIMDFKGEDLTEKLGGAAAAAGNGYTSSIGAFAPGDYRMVGFSDVVNVLSSVTVTTDPLILERAISRQIRRALEPFDIQVISSIDGLNDTIPEPTFFGFPSADLDQANALISLNEIAADDDDDTANATVPQFGADDVYLFFGGLYAQEDEVLIPLNIPLTAKFGVEVESQGSLPNRLDSGGIVDVNFWINRVLGPTGTGGTLNTAMANAAMYITGWDYGLVEVEDGKRGQYTQYFDSDTRLIDQSSAMVEAGWTESFVDYYSPDGVAKPISDQHSAYFNRNSLMQNGLDFHQLLRQGTLGNPPVLNVPGFPLPPPGFPEFSPPTYTINTDPNVRVSLYDLLANDPDIGRNPDVQYVTGTGAFDRIRIQKLDGNRASVSIQSYRDSNFNGLIQANSYTIDLSKIIIPGRRDSGQPFRLIIEGCNSDDQIFLDDRLGVQVVVHGGPDLERLMISGSGVENVQYTAMGSAVDPFHEQLIPELLLPAAAGRMVITGRFGSTTVLVDQFNPMNASAVRLDNFNSLQYNLPGYLNSDLNVTVPRSGEWRIAGTLDNPLFPIPGFPTPHDASTGKLDFTQIGHLVVDTSLGTADDNLTFSTDAALPPGLTSVFISMGGGIDHLTFDDSGNLANLDYFLSPTEVDYGTGVSTKFTGYGYHCVQQLTVNGTQGGNDFVVVPSTVTEMRINGDDPPSGSFGEDSLTIRRSGISGATVTPNGIGNGTWSFTSGHKDIVFTGIEELTAPPAIVALTGASDTGRGQPLVKVYEAASNELLYSFYAYPRSFRGGVRVAVGDMNGDSTPDLVVAPGAGRGDVKVYDGALLQTMADADAFVADPDSALLDTFIPESGSYRNKGLFVAVGDIDGDGDNDIATSRSRGQTMVRVFDNDGTGFFSRLTAWRPYSTNVVSGAAVAVADLDNDGLAEVITAPGAGVKTEIRVFDGFGGGLIRKFNAFESSFRNGVSLAAGDADGDGKAEIFVGAGIGGRSRVRMFSPLGDLKEEFRAYTSGNVNSPLRIATVDPDGADRVLLFVGQGNDGRSHRIRLFDPLTGNRIDEFLERDPAFDGGVFLG